MNDSAAFAATGRTVVEPATVREDPSDVAFAAADTCVPAAVVVGLTFLSVWPEELPVHPAIRTEHRRRPIRIHPNVAVFEFIILQHSWGPYHSDLSAHGLSRYTP